MKSEPETSREYKAFKSLLNRVMSVPHEEIVQREAEYKNQSDANPRKRGPKRKSVKASSRRAK